MEQLSMFDQSELIQDTHDSPKLNIVKMEFQSAEAMTWQELFDSFDTIKAITYSSGIGFVYQMLRKLRDAEIIFGCDEVISYSFEEIMAYQSKTLERMRNTAGNMKLDLITRIENETLRFFVARSVLSHDIIKICCRIPYSDWYTVRAKQERPVSLKPF